MGNVDCCESSKQKASFEFIDDHGDKHRLESNGAGTLQVKWFVNDMLWASGAPKLNPKTKRLVILDVHAKFPMMHTYVPDDKCEHLGQFIDRGSPKKSYVCGQDTVDGTWRTVQIAISVFPASKDWMIPGGHHAYHSSIILEGQEYFFDRQGIQRRPVAIRNCPPSHINKYSPRLLEVGCTRRTGEELSHQLHLHFQAGTYDLVRKNCNAFTDCALALLLGRRLPEKYVYVESIAKDLPMLVSIASRGRYKANPASNSFDVETVARRVDETTWMGGDPSHKVFVHIPDV